MEIDRSSGGTELMYARQKLATTAKAYDLQAIDMVYIDYKGAVRKVLLLRCVCVVCLLI